MSARFYGIGVGPGDPELVTVKAARLLARLAVVAVPESAAGRERIALGAAAPYCSPSVEILTLDFPMAKDPAVRHAARARAAALVVERLGRGDDVGFVSIGDPSHYSTFAYLVEAVAAAGYVVEMVPGVTSYSAAAARAGAVLVCEDERLAVVPVTAGMAVEPIIDAYDTVVFMKASVWGPGLAAALAPRHAAGRIAVTVVSRCGLAGESVSTDPACLAGEVPYLTTVIVRKIKEDGHV